MSSLRQFSDGRRQGKSPEKSNFVQTCNLLGKYIKEKGSLRNLNIEIGGKIESLEAIVKPGSSHSASVSTTMEIVTNKVKSAEPLKEQQPNKAQDSSITTLEDASYKPTRNDATSTDPKASQLTIFYSGRVFVFDDYPANKAKDLVAFAKKGSSQMSYGILSNTLPVKSSPPRAVPTALAYSPREGLPPRPQTSGSHKAVGISSNTCEVKTNAVASTSSQPELHGSDLPIARRSSIHRFLEKRRDRAAVRGPYQVQEEPASFYSSKGDEQLDLKL